MRKFQDLKSFSRLDLQDAKPVRKIVIDDFIDEKVDFSSAARYNAEQSSANQDDELRVLLRNVSKNLRDLKALMHG